MSRPDVRDSLGLRRSVRDRPLRDCVFVAGGVKRSGESVDVRNVARGGDKGLMGRVYIDKDGGAGQPEPDLGHFVRASTAVRSPFVRARAAATPIAALGQDVSLTESSEIGRVSLVLLHGRARPTLGQTLATGR